MKKLSLLLLMLSTQCFAVDGMVHQLVGNWGIFQVGNDRFQAEIYAMDMPRTFDSNSCLAAGGLLLLRRHITLNDEKTNQQINLRWYCWEKPIIEEIYDVR